MKRVAASILQIAITLGVLFFLFRDPEKRAEIGEALLKADRSWLLVGFLAYGMVEVLAAWRWHVVLKVQGIILSRFRLISLLLIGVFFNFFIPGGTGGDVIRAYYLIKEAPGKGPAALLSILVDRITGLFAVIFLAGVVIAFRWEWLTRTPKTHQCVVTALIVLGVSAAFVGFAVVLSSLGWVHRLPARFPARERFAEFAMAVTLYAKHWTAIVKAFLISVGCHLGYFFVFFCAAQAFESASVRVPTLWDFFAIQPVVDTITSLPISLGGLGVREGLFEIFLSQLTGIKRSLALLISSTGSMFLVFWGLTGGLLYLLYRPGKPRYAGISAEIKAAEHHLAEAELALETAESGKR